MRAISNPSSTMINEISLLTQFLDSLGPEVSGRSSSPLTSEQKEKIRLFAAGELSASERETLLPSILENEKALHELVQCLQAKA